MVSPGRTRRTSPTRTSSDGIISSPPLRTTRAVWGERSTSFSIPARALATVRSSRYDPICMMTAISAAANVSPMRMEAISAMDTRTSARMSKRVTRPITASMIMGIPQRMIAIHPGSTGKLCPQKKLIRTAAADRMIHISLRFSSS